MVRTVPTISPASASTPGGDHSRTRPRQVQGDSNEARRAEPEQSYQQPTERVTAGPNPAGHMGDNNDGLARVTEVENLQSMEVQENSCADGMNQEPTEADEFGIFRAHDGAIINLTQVQTVPHNLGGSNFVGGNSGPRVGNNPQPSGEQRRWNSNAPENGAGNNTRAGTTSGWN